MEGVFRFKSWFLNARSLYTVGLIIGILRYLEKAGFNLFILFFLKVYISGKDTAVVFAKLRLVSCRVISNFFRSISARLTCSSNCVSFWLYVCCNYLALTRLGYNTLLPFPSLLPAHLVFLHSSLPHSRMWSYTERHFGDIL